MPRNQPSGLKAGDVIDYLEGLGTWVDWSNTADGLVIGDRNADVHGIAIAWQSQWPALRVARDLGCNLFITHEPTFYHPVSWETPDRSWDSITEAKRTWLEESQMVVYRCHDVADVLPRYGMLDSWARALGLDHEPLDVTAPWIGLERPYKLEIYLRLYEIEPVRVDDLARRLANRFRDLGQGVVDVLGSGDKEIRHLAIGTGAITPPVEMAALRGPNGERADAIIAVDDSFFYWNGGSWAIDSGIPMIIFSHGVSEEFGTRGLADLVRGAFPTVSVHQIPQGRQYRAVAAAG